MAKIKKLRRSRKVEQKKLTQAIKMAEQGKSSPGGQRLPPRTVRHRELEATFVPMVPLLPRSKRRGRKQRLGRHHAPP